jgi:putative acetyltransferase
VAKESPGLLIEAEQPGDAPEISRVHAIAFSNGGRRSGDGEVRLVDELRGSPAWIPKLSLVARADGRVVGHLLFSLAAIETPAGDVPVLALAPLAVLPGFEPAFVGTRLMRVGLAEARSLGFRGVIVLGHPKYYRRFGFCPAGRIGILAPFPVDDDAWMALELIEDSFSGLTGTVRYPAAFTNVPPRSQS